MTFRFFLYFVILLEGLDYVTHVSIKIWMWMWNFIKSTQIGLGENCKERPDTRIVYMYLYVFTWFMCNISLHIFRFKRLINIYNNTKPSNMTLVRVIVSFDVLHAFKCFQEKTLCSLLQLYTKDIYSPLDI